MHGDRPDTYWLQMHFVRVLAERYRNFHHELLTRVDPGQVKHVNSPTGLLTSLTLNLHSSPFSLASIIHEMPYEKVINA